MSGFISILDPPEEVPHLQALVDDIKDIPLLSASEGRLKANRRDAAKADPAAGSVGSRLPKHAAANVIHLHRRGAEAEKPPLYPGG